MMIQENKARLQTSHKMDAGTRWVARSCLPRVSHTQLPSSHAGARDSTKVLSRGVELGHMATVKDLDKKPVQGKQRGETSSEENLD